MISRLVHRFVIVLNKVRKKWKTLVLNYNKFFHPKRYADYLYRNMFGYGINWRHPRDLNEWINYFQFKTDTHEWSRLSDKIAVREYVSKKGLGFLLIPLIGVWEDVDEIDFATMPNSFVIKTNHACGDTILVLDKARAQIDLIREKLRDSLSLSYGRESAEPHYFRIKPKVFAEQLLPPPTNSDYKVWCFFGRPECIMTITTRDIESGSYCISVYDLAWQKHPEWITPHYQNSVDVPKPEKLDEMIEYARILSEGFPEVRVDFYHTDAGVFFGELTFTSAAGRMTYFTEDYLIHCGEIINHHLHSGEKDHHHS